jgi:hypothetical protein
MPAKGWRKKKEDRVSEQRKRLLKKDNTKKPEPQVRTFDFDITFDDITLAETDGVFSEVKSLMAEEYSPNWILRSKIHIKSVFGEGLLIAQFYSDMTVCITDYFNKMETAYFNADIKVFSSWCQNSGWKVPEVSAELIKLNPFFWKEIWRSNLIDSSYLEERFGKRSYESSEFDDVIEDETY